MPHHLATQLVRLRQVVIEVIAVRDATAAAIILRGTLSAIFLGIHVNILKGFLDIAVESAVHNVAHKEFSVAACKLVTRENVARRRDRNVLFARTATGEPFRNARSVFKVDHIMEEIEPFVALSSFDIFFRQLVVLLKNFGQVFFVQCKRTVVSVHIDIWHICGTALQKLNSLLRREGIIIFFMIICHYDNDDLIKHFRASADNVKVSHCNRVKTAGTYNRFQENPSELLFIGSEFSLGIFIFLKFFNITDFFRQVLAVIGFTHYNAAVF